MTSFKAWKKGDQIKLGGVQSLDAHVRKNDPVEKLEGAIAQKNFMYVHKYQGSTVLLRKVPTSLLPQFLESNVDALRRWVWLCASCHGRRCEQQFKVHGQPHARCIVYSSFGMPHSMDQVWLCWFHWSGQGTGSVKKVKPCNQKRCRCFMLFLHIMMFVRIWPFRATVKQFSFWSFWRIEGYFRIRKFPSISKCFMVFAELFAVVPPCFHGGFNVVSRCGIWKVVMKYI